MKPTPFKPSKPPADFDYSSLSSEELEGLIYRNRGSEDPSQLPSGQKASIEHFRVTTRSRIVPGDVTDFDGATGILDRVDQFDGK
jgi:hypothetical protein